MTSLIREERKARGFTQDEFARRLKITQGQLSKIEADELSPNVLVWLEFCALTGLPESLPLDEKACKAVLARMRALVIQNKRKVGQGSR